MFFQNGNNALTSFVKNELSRKEYSCVLYYYFNFIALNIFFEYHDSCR
jgi:hypothetical protein